MKTTPRHQPLIYPKTRHTAQAFFKRNGICVLHWASDLGLPYATVIDALRGKSKGYRGSAHKVAVALGLKQGK